MIKFPKSYVSYILMWRSIKMNSKYNFLFEKSLKVQPGVAINTAPDGEIPTTVSYPSLHLSSTGHPQICTVANALIIQPSRISIGRLQSCT